MTAALCMWCHTCIQLGHSRATSTSAGCRARCGGHRVIAGGSGRLQTNLAAPQHPPVALVLPLASPQWNSWPGLTGAVSTQLSPAQCTRNPLPSTALSCWRSEHLPRHFANIESLHEEMQFLPAASDPEHVPALEGTESMQTSLVLGKVKWPKALASSDTGLRRKAAAWIKLTSKSWL